MTMIMMMMMIMVTIMMMIMLLLLLLMMLLIWFMRYYCGSAMLTHLPRPRCKGQGGKKERDFCRTGTPTLGKELSG